MIKECLDIVKANKEITRLKKENKIAKENREAQIISSNPRLKQLNDILIALTAENKNLKQKESQLKNELDSKLSQIKMLEAEEMSATNKTNSILHQLGVPTGNIRF